MSIIATSTAIAATAATAAVTTPMSLKQKLVLGIGGIAAAATAGVGGTLLIRHLRRKGSANNPVVHTDNVDLGRPVVTPAAPQDDEAVKPELIPDFEIDESEELFIDVEEDEVEAEEAETAAPAPAPAAEDAAIPAAADAPEAPAPVPAAADEAEIPAAPAAPEAPAAEDAANPASAETPSEPKAVEPEAETSESEEDEEISAERIIRECAAAAERLADSRVFPLHDVPPCPIVIGHDEAGNPTVSEAVMEAHETPAPEAEVEVHEAETEAAAPEEAAPAEAEEAPAPAPAVEDGPSTCEGSAGNAEPVEETALDAFKKLVRGLKTNEATIEKMFALSQTYEFDVERKNGQPSKFIYALNLMLLNDKFVGNAVRVHGDSDEDLIEAARMHVALMDMPISKGMKISRNGGKRVYEIVDLPATSKKPVFATPRYFDPEYPCLKYEEFVAQLRAKDKYKNLNEEVMGYLYQRYMISANGNAKRATDALKGMEGIYSRVIHLYDYNWECGPFFNLGFDEISIAEAENLCRKIERANDVMKLRWIFDEAQPAGSDRWFLATV